MFNELLLSLFQQLHTVPHISLYLATMSILAELLGRDPDNFQFTIDTTSDQRPVIELTEVDFMQITDNYLGNPDTKYKIAKERNILYVHGTHGELLFTIKRKP